ncbi:hypothetical protein Dimus_036745, partial [Dionaea muscipula]
CRRSSEGKKGCFRCGKFGHRVALCRAPFDPTRKVWQVRDWALPNAGSAKQPQLSEGMTGEGRAAMDQQRDVTQVELSDQLWGWKSFSKKGSSRPVIYSPGHISLHKRFEGLEHEENKGVSEQLRGIDTGQSSECYEVEGVEHSVAE